MAEHVVHYQKLFHAEGVDPGILVPTSILCREELGRCHTTTIELFNDTAAPLEVRAMMRKMAELVFVGADGQVAHRFSGMITRVLERATPLGAQQVITVTLECPLHLLRVSSDARIYQSLTTKEIVSKILEQFGLTEVVAWRLSGSYEPRDVCTQYGESTFDFISRLLEEEGIFYFQEQKEGGKLVFGDAPASYAPIEGDPEVKVHQASGLLPEETLGNLRQVERLRPAKVTLRDHDFKKPSLELEGTAESKSPFTRELYQYPGGFPTPSVGTARAKTRLAALVADASGVEGQGQVLRLAAGHTFKLEEPVAEIEGTEFVVHWIEHVFRQPNGVGAGDYHARFRLLPKAQRFCPMPITPKPHVAGPHVASVTGPSGQEIHCDEFGRIKVLFAWDRHGKQDDTSSFWVRVGQLHTSGAVVIPRVGWEVLVDFENGDIDNPIVLGKVYNGTFRPPAALPAQKTVSQLSSFSTPGGSGHNEIKMDDGAGSEIISIHAQKDYNLVVANNKEEKVTTSSDHGVGTDHVLKIGANQIIQIGGNDGLNVGGNQKYSVGAARTKTVTGDDKIEVKGDRSVTIGASHTTLTPMSVTITTSGALKETVGASCIEAAAMGLAYSVAGSIKVSVGGAKVEAVAGGKNDTTIGSRSTKVGGAFVNTTGKDITTTTTGKKTTLVGGAFLANAGGDAEFSTSAALKISVGGAVIMNGSGKILLKVGGSTVTIAAGGVVLDSSEIKLTASGPNAELAPMPASK